MGTWGTGLFQDDIAVEIREAFESALKEGLGVAAATRQTLADFADVFADKDDQIVAYLALASLQLRRKAVQPAVRRKVLSILTKGLDLKRWEGRNSADFRRRQRVLERLHQRLNHD